MKSVSELFWQASLSEIKQGYVFLESEQVFVCLVCGKSFNAGEIYQEESRFFDARKYMEVHIEHCHKSMFHVLLNLDKKLTGLTDHQKSILELFHGGNDDNEVAQKTGIGSTSTIRNHRFTFRERQKQAKVFLSIMELLAETIPPKNSFIEIPRNTKQVDERFAVTQQENQQILAAHFKQGLSGPLASYPLKEKKRIVILRQLAKLFDVDKQYSEKEVNAILQPFFEDHVMLRRHLIEYGFMERTPDGTSYWIKL
jgi:hypothetical protein